MLFCVRCFRIWQTNHQVAYICVYTFVYKLYLGSFVKHFVTVARQYWRPYGVHGCRVYSFFQVGLCSYCKPPSPEVSLGGIVALLGALIFTTFVLVLVLRWFKAWSHKSIVADVIWRPTFGTCWSLSSSMWRTPKRKDLVQNSFVGFRFVNTHFAIYGESQPKCFGEPHHATGWKSTCFDIFQEICNNYALEWNSRAVSLSLRGLLII